MPGNLELKILPGGNEPGGKPLNSYQRLNGVMIRWVRWLINSTALLLGDFVGLLGSLYLGGYLRALIKGSPHLPEWDWYLLLIWAAGALFIRLVPGWGLGPVEELRRNVILLVAVFATTTTALFLGKIATETSRLTLSLAFIFSMFFIPFIRIQVKRLLIRQNLWGMPALIYADLPSARSLIESLKQDQGLGYIPVAVYDESCQHVGENILGVPVVEDPTENSYFADVVVFATQGISRHRMLEIIDGPLSQFRHLVLIPDLVDTPSLWIKPRDVGGVLGLEISSNLLDPLSRGLKRVSDLLIVGLTSPIWLPFMAMLYVLVWLQDRRNPLFAQERVGHDGTYFRMIKFRTMYTNAEEVLQAKLDEDPELKEEWNRNFKLRKDPRITPIGRLLRRTSLDEMPQLWNVLRNEMSLVGPRPLPDYHDTQLPDRVRRLRQRVKPGMTGLWQVSGRSEVGNLGIQKWDSYYVRNWSIWLDIVVLVRTIRVVLTGRGAY